MSRLAGAVTNPMPEFLVFPDKFDKLLMQMSELHHKKRSDYTGLTGDILHNYRQSSALAGISMEQGMFARLCEKVVRISSVLSKDGQTEVTDEKLEDTLLDLAIISLLMIIGRGERNADGNERPAGMADAPCGTQQCGDCRCSGNVEDQTPGTAVGDQKPQPGDAGAAWYFSVFDDPKGNS